MSRIGRKPINVPASVTVTAEGSQVVAKGPKGELALATRPEVDVVVDGNVVTVENKGGARDRQARAFHGMTRALIQNMVTGVAQGYERKLEINGVGYEAELKGKEVVLQLGFAHPVHFPVPDSVTVEVPSRTSILVKGCDKQQVGMVAAEIRKLRPPEPYKGKGIKYDNEIIKRKQGKAFGSA